MPMRIPSGKTDQSIYFVAFAAADGSRLTGLSGFTVYRSRNGAAEVAYTTPTITEIDATNMPGVYALLIDEDTTIASTSDSEEYCVHISVATMVPITRTIELYRRDTTSGQTLSVSSGGLSSIAANTITATSINSGAFTAAKFANDAITSAVMSNGARDAISSNVWASATRTLTALDEDSTTLDLDATIRAALGLTTANLDTQLAALPTADENADALLDRSAGVETGLTPREAWRLVAAACAGKASGFPTTTVTYRNAVADTKNRIVATVDADGNRSAITVDLT